MTISDRIFQILKERNMTQKEFSKKCGIAESSISDWKRKRTNPSAENILNICNALGVSADELLSGTIGESDKSPEANYYVISKDSSMGEFINIVQNLNTYDRGRLEGYLRVLAENKEAGK